MFWFTIIMVLLTYPIIFMGSCLCLVFIAIFSTGSPSDTPNPFVTPAAVYQLYRESFDSWLTALREWYQRENNK